MIAYDSGSGTPLVMVHGFGVDHRILEPLAAEAEALGWRCILVDLPWTEHADDRTAASTTDVVRGVQRDIADVIGDEPFAILGNSFGGMVARQIAHDWRDRVLGLATIAGVFVADHGARDLPEPTVIIDEPGADDAAGPGGYRDFAVVRTVDNARLWRLFVAPGLATADMRTMERISRAYDLDSHPEDGEAFTAPTLILAARQDSSVGYRDAWRMLEHYPRATFAVLDAAGHNVHLDAPDLARAHVADWLRRMSFPSDAGSTMDA